MKHIWVTGANGLIGGEILRQQVSAVDFQLRGLTRAEVDLADDSAVAALFRQERPDAIIHCAALSKTGACRQQPELAQLLNVHVTETLAGLAASIPFIFFSTDLVFNGRKGHYAEEDTVDPLCIYSATKVLAEKIVLANLRHTVVRTSLNFGFSDNGQRSFNEEWAQMWQRGETLDLFVDEFRCPIPVEVTAQTVLEILRRGLTGCYHLAGGRRMSRVEMGGLLAEFRAPLPSPMRPSSLADWKGPARAADTSLNCAKLERALNIQLPGLEDWLRQNWARQQALAGGDRE
ncbi:MAG: SDR family oxidoreductase [Verrucomicrobiota bacterium]